MMKLAFVLLFVLVCGCTLTSAWNVPAGPGNKDDCAQNLLDMALQKYPHYKDMLESFGLGIGSMGDYHKCVNLDQPVNYCVIGPLPQEAIGVCLPGNCTTQALDDDLIALLLSLHLKVDVKKDVNCEDTNVLPPVIERPMSVVTLTIIAVLVALSIGTSYKEIWRYLSKPQVGIKPKVFLTPNPEIPDIQDGNLRQRNVEGVAVDLGPNYGAIGNGKSETAPLTGDEKKKEKTLAQKLGDAFNGWKITESVFAKGGGMIEPLHGVRVLAMCWVILAHSFQAIMPIMSDPFFIKDDFVRYWPNMLLGSAQYAVDTFFWLGGFLQVLSLMRTFENRKTFRWAIYPEALRNRLLRIWPVYGFILLVYVNVIPYFGSGPMWHQTDSRRDICNNYWWATLLFVNNFIGGWDNVCISWGWYITVDMQLFLIVPIIIYVFYKSRIPGWIIITVLSFASIVWTMLIVYTYGVSDNLVTYLMDHDKGELYFNLIYDAPQHRIVPYLIGIATGVIYIDYVKPKMGTLTVPRLARWFGFAVAFAGLAVATFIHISDYILGYSTWSEVDYALFIPLSKVVWTLSLAVIVMLCVIGHGGLIRAFLTNRLFTVLAKINFCAYLIHPIIIGVTYYTMDSLLYVRSSHVFILTLFFVMATYSVALFLYVVVEMPFANLINVVFPKRR